MSLMLPRRREDLKDPDAESGVSEKNPWKEIEGTVRKVDEDKVKDCTEDVDALLVFAGLYSAVLTAFLIESYKNLAADETNTLLQQMVLQTANYRFTNGYLNSTFDPSLLPTFKAAVSDIRVNVCWFASLILSLSSASFGIAVKQWLREFLAIDYISPQERLRIRDARVQGLTDWKLFQIAAFLPILLQTSLLLFFVGLCFFTAAVHRSIGITSLFLVSCWAFLFFMSIVAPLFSPRCPYKTTLLKVPFRYARPHIRSFPGFAYEQITTLLARLGRKKTTDQEDEDAITSAERMQASTKEFTYYDDCLDSWNLMNLSERLSPVDEEATAPEETKIRSADGKDLIIFCNIDVNFLDDSLLASMPQALSQRPPPLRDMLRSVVAILQRRIGLSLSKIPAEKNRRRVPWPWSLSQTARIAVVDMLVESMVHDLHSTDRDPWSWEKLETPDSEWTMAFTLLILLVTPQGAAPKSVTRLFRAFMEYRWWGPIDVFSYQMRALAQSDPDWPARSLLFFAQGRDALKAEESETALRRVLIQGFLERDAWPTFETYVRLLERNINEGDGDVVVPTPQRIIALLEVARVILHDYILEAKYDRDEDSDWPSILLGFVFDATPRLMGFPGIDFRVPLTRVRSDGPGLCELLADLFTTPQTTGQLLHFLATRTDLLSSTRPGHPLSVPNLIQGIRFVSTNRDAGIKILTACTVFFISQSTSASEESFIVNSPTNLLHLCSVIWRYATTDDEEMVATWQKLFTAIYACYEHIIQLDFNASPVTCPYSDSYNQHTETCETAYTILGYCDHYPYKCSYEMADFLRMFVCARHTFDWQGRKLRLIERLEIAKAAVMVLEEAPSKQPSDAVVQKLEPATSEAKSSGATPADTWHTVVIPIRDNSADHRLYTEDLASPDTDSASRGSVVTGDTSLGAVMSPPIRSASFSGPTFEAALRNHPDVSGTKAGACGSHSADVRDSSALGSLPSHEDSPSTVRPARVGDSVQVVDTPHPALAVSDSTHFSDDAGTLGGTASNKDVGAAAAAIAHDESPSGREEKATASSDVADSKGSVGDVTESNAEGSGQLVTSDMSRPAVPVVPDAYSYADGSFGGGYGAEISAIATSPTEVEED